MERAAKTDKTARLDAIAVERGLFPTKESARTAIMEGMVLVDGKPVIKPGFGVKLHSTVELSSAYNPPKYVSRGGLKLEKALCEFQLDVTSRICLDVGASTGGFTDCLLKHGASFVYAVDVGYGQLDWTLRKDNRVKVLERVNARHLTASMLSGDNDANYQRPTFATMDVSFISVFKVLPAVIDCLDQNLSELVVLIKPQFEAGRQSVGHGGVVRDAAVHLDVLKTAVLKAGEKGLTIMAGCYSPIKGPKGNIEFLLYFSKEKKDRNIDLKAIVESAHRELASHKEDEEDKPK